MLDQTSIGCFCQNSLVIDARLLMLVLLSNKFFLAQIHVYIQRIIGSDVLMGFRLTGIFGFGAIFLYGILGILRLLILYGDCTNQSLRWIGVRANYIVTGIVGVKL